MDSESYPHRHSRSGDEADDMNACGPHCGYCGRCTMGEAIVRIVCEGCGRTFHLHPDEVQESADLLCDSCCSVRLDRQRYERAGGVWPW